MPRLLNGQEVFKYVNKVSVLRIKAATPGDTTTSAALARAAVNVGVASSTNFTNGEFAFVIGSGGTDVVKLGAPAATMPFTTKPLFAQDIGARLVSAEEIQLGHISEQGVTFGGSMTLNPVKAATSRTPIAYISDPGEMTASLSLLGHNNQNLMLAFGATEAEDGAGNTADPYQVGVGQTTMGSQGLQAIRILGERHDAKIVEMLFVAAQVEVNVNSTLGSGQQSGIPVSMKFTNLIQRIYI